MENTKPILTTDNNLADFGMPPALLLLLSYFIDSKYMDEFILTMVMCIKQDVQLEFIEFVQYLCIQCNGIIEEALNYSECLEETDNSIT